MDGGGPAEVGDHGGEIVAAVEAVLELGQIARHVLVTDGVEGAGQAPSSWRRGGLPEGRGSVMRPA